MWENLWYNKFISDKLFGRKEEIKYGNFFIDTRVGN